MLRNLASALFLTERETDDAVDKNIPKVKGRIVTTLHKAKEVRPLVEKCITIARRSLKHEEAAEEYATDARRNSDQWREWRNSSEWRQWNNAIAPTVAARRRVVQLIGDKEAMQVLFDELAPRFEDRDGGYTRIVRLAKPRLGDSGQQAILEFVGVRDRERQESEKPAFEAEEESATVDADDEAAEADDEEAAETDSPDAEASEEDSATEDSAEEDSADEEEKKAEE